MAQVFVTGITGYIGGTVIQKLLAKHDDELEIVALVRSQSKADKVTSIYPKIRTVIGDLESEELITEESSKADIVLNMADIYHEGHVKSIYKGMAKHDGTAYLIHTSGADVLVDPTLSAVGEASQTELSDKEYDDIRDIKLINLLPDENVHRNVDKVVMETAPENVKQAIICPPLIYGRGSGPGNQGSVQLPVYIKSTLERKEAFTVGKGQAGWNNVHVQDLGDLYVLLVEEALKEGGGKATWGKEGYYFAENGKSTWIDLHREVARLAKEKGLIPSAEIAYLSHEEIQGIYEFGLLLWGTNSWSKSSRARQQLGWKPSQPSILDTINEELDIAKTSLASN